MLAGTSWPKSLSQNNNLRKKRDRKPCEIGEHSSVNHLREAHPSGGLLQVATPTGSSLCHQGRPIMASASTRPLLERGGWQQQWLFWMSPCSSPHPQAFPKCPSPCPSAPRLLLPGWASQPCCLRMSQSPQPTRGLHPGFFYQGDPGLCHARHLLQFWQEKALARPSLDRSWKWLISQIKLNELNIKIFLKNSRVVKEWQI